MTQVPVQYQPWVTQAAANTGLPAAIVAAQINEESGFKPSVTSPTGAQGIAQIEPDTWAGLGIAGSPYDPGPALAGYSKIMRQLLAQFHGNVRDALAAYNAGAGNLAAGYGYADAILSAAGAGNLTATPNPTGSTQSAAGGAPGAATGALAGLSATVAGVPVAGLFVVLGGVLLLVVAMWAGGVAL